MWLVIVSIIVLGVLAFIIFLLTASTVVASMRQQNVIAGSSAANSDSNASPHVEKRASGVSQLGDSCANCGAAIGIQTEVSPRGDFKCEFCNSWANVGG